MIYCCYRYGYEEFEIFDYIVSCIILHDQMIPDTWYLTLVLDMLYLTPDSWHLIFDTGIWHVITWHLTLDTWHMTLDNWHAIIYLTCFHMVPVHLTWCCDTWLDTITPDTCLPRIFMIINFTGTWYNYYIVTRHLVLLNSCASELLYTWTPEKGRLLILYSCWSS